MGIVVLTMLVFGTGFIMGLNNMLENAQGALDPVVKDTQIKLDLALQNLEEIRKDARYIDSAGTLPVIIKIRDAVSLTVAKTLLSSFLRPPLNYNSPIDLNIIHSIAARVNINSLSDMANDLNVEKVWLDAIVQTDLDQSIPLINADDVWQTRDTNGLPFKGRGVKIAVIDGGIDYTHPDFGSCSSAQFASGLCAKVTKGKDFVNNDNDPMDDNGHGTHVASTAAGTGAASNEKFIGVAPEAEIWSAKVTDSSGHGFSSNTIAGIDWATDPNGDGSFSDRADIISMSIGNVSSQSLSDPRVLALNAAADRGVLPVISAGNSGASGDTVINSSASSEKSLMVAATYKNENGYSGCADSAPYTDKVWCLSSKGPAVINEYDTLAGYYKMKGIASKPDISAPGVSVCAAKWSGYSITTSCGSNAKYISMSGTSMATPIVSGVAALLKQEHPSWSPQEIKSALTLSAKDIGYKPTYGGSGRIDILKASLLNFVADKSSVSFGVISTGSRQRSLKVTSKSSSNLTLTISVRDASRKDGLIKSVVSSSDSTITLIPSESKTLTFSTVAIDSVPRGIYEGVISISNGQDSYTVPYILAFENNTGTVSINSGDTYTRSSSVNLTLYCPDTVSSCSQMQFSNDNITYSVLESYATSKSWILAQSDGTKTVYVKYKDNTGRMLSAIPDTIVLDATPPNATILINNDATYTNSQSVNLDLTFYDATSGVKDCRYGNDVSAWTAWETCSAVRSWTLPSGDGVKTVYYELRDNALNSKQASDPVVLDTTIDTITITKPLYYHAYVADSGEVDLGALGEPIKKPNIIGPLTIKADISNVGSPVSKVEFLIDNKLMNTDILVPYEWTWTPSLLTESGDRTITIKSTDAAGNIASQTMVVNVVPTGQ